MTFPFRVTAVIYLGAAIVLTTMISCKDDGVSSSYCKESDAVSTVSSTVSLEAGVDDGGGAEDAGAFAKADYTALYCVEYSTAESTSLKINIINYWADCRGPFNAEITDGSSSAIEVTVTPEQCASSGCLCPYDFSLDAGNIDLKIPITLTIGRFSCITFNTESHETVTLHPDESSSGIICQYFGRTGEKHGLCADGETCDEGLICEDSETLSGFEPVCLVPCETRFDCPVPESFTCDDGACHVIPNMTQTV
jgi:hypothetical protein